MAKSKDYYNSLPDCSIVDYEVIPLPEAALLWCGVKHSELSEEMKFLTKVSQSIYRHPYIPCLEKKTRVLTTAVNNGTLQAVREHGNGGEIYEVNGEKRLDHVAYDRRHFYINTLKKFISEHYPNDRPKTLFHDEELKPIIDLAEYERMSKEYHKLLAENTNLQTKITELKTDLASKESEIRDKDLTMLSLSTQAQQALTAKQDAEERLEKGRELYRQLQRQKSVNPDKVANVLKLMSLAISDLPKKGDNLTASGLNTYLHGLKAQIERETRQLLPFSIPDTKTLLNYLK